MSYCYWDFYKVVSNNESLPDIFDTFSEAYDALKGWDKEYCTIQHCRGDKAEIVFCTEWEDKDE